MPAIKRLGRLSIVVPVYFNEANLPETIPALLRLQDSLPSTKLELVFVDDGSKDRSSSVLQEWQSRHPDKIAVVRLTRNFGSMAAIQAGLTAATGDCVGVISADLQDPPELFLTMIEHWRNGVKVALATRKTRDEGVFIKLFAALFYKLMNTLALSGYPRGGFDFCLIDRQVVGDLIRMEEKNTNIMALIFWLGYKPEIIPYSRKKREGGVSRWTFMKRVKLFIDSFVSFSYAPIRFITTAGILIAACSLLYTAFILYYKLRFDHPVQGYTTLAMMLAFSFGAQMMALGIIGEYLWRTLDGSRRRPQYVIDSISPASSREDS